MTPDKKRIFIKFLKLASAMALIALQDSRALDVSTNMEFLDLLNQELHVRWKQTCSYLDRNSAPPPTFEAWRARCASA